jgi:hypothetical protein
MKKTTKLVLFFLFCGIPFLGANGAAQDEAVSGATANPHLFIAPSFDGVG